MSQIAWRPFDIRRGSTAWTWRILTGEAAGRAGEAPTRALAAACVIRILAETSVSAPRAPARSRRLPRRPAPRSGRARL